MNIIVQRADLARALTAVSKAVEKRHTIPILGCVHLGAAAGELRVRGTDLDIEITSVVPASVAEPGEVCVDAVRLLDIARKMAGDEVTLSLAGDKLTVKAGRSRFNLATLPAGDFPTLMVGDLPHRFNIDLAALFKPVQFAISSEMTRYYLCGVFLHVIDGVLRAVATDGHRLSMNTAPAPAEFPGVIVPSKTVGLVPAGEVDVALSTSKIRMSAGGTVIVSKLIDGTFPDYQRVIPTANFKVAIVDRDELSRAAGRVSTVASERGRAVRVSLAENSANLSMASADAGSAEEDIDVTYESDPLVVGMNATYLGDILSVMADEAEIAFADPGSPILFNSAAGVTCVLMPMMVAQ